MELTVLGCWSPYPRAGGACSSYWLEVGGQQWLLECGNGSFSQLQRFFAWRDLDMVLISHFHADHEADFFCLRHALAGSIRDGSRTKPLKVLVPSQPEHYSQAWQGKPGILAVHTWETLGEQLANGTLKLGQAIKIDILKTKHPLDCFAVKITEVDSGKTLVYTADTAWMDELVDFAAGADLLIAEASLLEVDKAYRSAGHLTAREAGELARLAGVNQLLLSHLWPEYDLEELLSEAGQGFSGQIVLAVEGRKISSY